MQCPLGHCIMLYKRGDAMQCPLGHCIIKTFYSNPQYNPISLCIKGLITASKPTSDQMLRSKQNL